MAAALALGACGGDDEKPAATASAAKPAATSAEGESFSAINLPRDARVTVTLKGRAFRPAYISGRPGQTLVFKNEDDVDHRIRATFGVPWSSGRLSPGETYELRTEREGDAMGIDFICTIHSEMYGAMTWPGG